MSILMITLMENGTKVSKQQMGVKILPTSNAQCFPGVFVS